MQKIVQFGGITASLLSCVFWVWGAGIGFRRLSLFSFGGSDSIPSALQRQSVMNAFAALFAAVAAACQAAALFLQSG
jgi:hypothetical protein